MIAASPHSVGVGAPEGKDGGLGRVVLVLASTALLLGLVGVTFWYQDWRYSLPTPRPRGFEQAALGARIELAAPLAPHDGRPVFLHFTSPDCPCSRFTLDHVRALVRAHGDEVHFVAVIEVEGEDGNVAEPLARGVTGLGIPEIADAGRIAARLGVYSTPQAVILDADGTLRYRGNYNVSRYCARPESEFARLTLEALLAGQALPAFPEAATRAYGCALPTQEGGEAE